MEDFDDFNGDDFMDDFDDEGDFMDDNSFEDSFNDNLEPEDPLDDDSGIEAEPAGDDICGDEFTMKDAVFLGGAMGFAYEEGLEERKRRKLEKKMEADRNNRDREDGI